MRGIFGAVAVMLLAGRADAHQFEHPKVLRLGVGGDRLVLSVTYDVNPGRDALRTRGLFDRNADGGLDEAERERLVAYLEQTARLWLELKVDGLPAALVRASVTPFKLDLPADSTDVLGVALLYTAPLPASEVVRIELSDRERDPDKHVPLVVDLGPEWIVGLATDGELYPAARQLRRIGLGVGAPFALTIRRAAPAPGPPRP